MAAALLIMPEMGSWRDSFGFRDSVSRLTAAFSLARISAIREGRPVQASTSLGAHLVVVDDKRVDFGQKAKVIEVSPAVPSKAGDLWQLNFYPDGSADAGQITLEGPHGLVDFAVNPVTGRAAVHWRD